MARFEATWKSLQRYNCPQWFRLGSGHTGGLSVLDEFAWSIRVH